MKILCLSDTHCYKVPGLPEADVLLHTGDWSSYGSEGETVQFFAWLNDVEHKFGDIVIVPGNHDKWPFANPDVMHKMCESRGYHYLDDLAATIQGKKFYGMPWTPTFGHRWAYNADLAARMLRCAAIPDDTQVLGTHGPPHKFMGGVENFCGKQCEWETLHAGCTELRKAIERVKPQLHAFGHIHEGSGEEDYGGIRLVNASIMDRHYRPVNPYRLVEIA